MKRTISSTDFFITMVKIEHEVINFLLSDFDFKHSTRSLKLFSYKAKLTKKEEEDLNKIVENHKDCINFETSYPLWILEYMRDKILKDLAEIRNKIIEANTIYPNSEYEYNKKREHQTSAIAGYYKLLSNLQFAIEIFHPSTVEKYMPLVNAMEKEIKLLKGWKKYTAKCYVKIQEGKKKEQERKNNVHYQKSNAYNPYKIVDVRCTKDDNGVYQSETFVEIGKRKMKINVSEVECTFSPFHFVPEEISTNVSFDKFVEKDNHVNPIHFVPIVTTSQLTII